jgi:hypothetical protein
MIAARRRPFPLPAPPRPPSPAPLPPKRYGVAHRNYGQEAYYKAAAAYFKQEFYLDSIMG